MQRNFYLPSILSSLLNLILFFAIILSGKALDVYIGSLFFWLFFANGVLLMVAYAFYNKDVFSIRLPSFDNIQKMLRFSALTLTANIVFFLVYRIDYLFVKYSAVCSSADLGNYIQASKLGQMLLLVPQVLASVIFPQTASGADRAMVNNTLTIISRLFSQGFLLLLLLLLVVGKWFLPFVFGNTFNKMYWAFVLLLPGIFSLSVLALLSAYFSGKGKVKVNITGAFISLVIVTTGDYFLIPLYGINAAAAMSTIAYSAGMFYSLYCFYKDYSISFSGFFKWRRTDYQWLIEAINKKR